MENKKVLTYIFVTIIVALFILTALFFYDWSVEKQAAEIMIKTSHDNILTQMFN